MRKKSTQPSRLLRTLTCLSLSLYLLSAWGPGEGLALCFDKDRGHIAVEYIELDRCSAPAEPGTAGDATGIHASSERRCCGTCVDIRLGGNHVLGEARGKSGQSVKFKATPQVIRVGEEALLAQRFVKVSRMPFAPDHASKIHQLHTVVLVI